MKILLVQPPFTLPPDVPLVVHQPLGLCFLAAAARRAGHDVAILDALAEGWRRSSPAQDGDPRGRTHGLGRRDVEARLEEVRPEVVGISVPFTLQWANAQRVAGWIKAWNPSIRVVVGGILPTIEPERALACPDVDFVLRGEADESFPHLLAAIGGARDPSDVDGVAYRVGDGIVVRPKERFVEDLDALPRPAWDLLRLPLYWSAGRVHGFNLEGRRSFNVITSRGCPARCVFCNIAPLWGRLFRARSPDSVLDELEYLVSRHGADHVQFEDDNLTFDLPRAKSIFRGMIRRRLGLAWNTPNGIALWRMDRECLDLMREAGCYHVSFAIESASPRVLRDVMRKPLDLEQVLPLIPYARGLGMKVAAFFVIGVPGETREEIQASFDLPYTVDLDWVEYSIATPHPGTELRRMAEEGGWLRPGPLSRLYARRGNIDTPEFTADELERKVLSEHRRYLTYLAIHRPGNFLSQGWEVFRRDPALVLRYLRSIARGSW